MDSLAITDHGNLHGAWSFYAEAKARKIRPILGFEAYLAFGSRKPARNRRRATRRSVFAPRAARQEQGRYQNLIKLSSIGFLEGYYRRPRIDKEVLERHHDGIIGWLPAVGRNRALSAQGTTRRPRRAPSGLHGPSGPTLLARDPGPRIAEERLVMEGMLRLVRNWGCRSPRRTMRIT